MAGRLNRYQREFATHAVLPTPYLLNDNCHAYVALLHLLPMTEASKGSIKRGKQKHLSSRTKEGATAGTMNGDDAPYVGCCFRAMAALRIGRAMRSI